MRLSGVLSAVCPTEVKMEEEIKKKTTFWIYPSMLRKMDGMLEADNCASRSEFVEKALRFYIGYLESNNAADYLCEVLGALISGIYECQ